MKYFTITTNHETAKEVERLHNSVVMKNRTCQIGSIDFSNPNFQIVQIVAVGEKLNTEDILPINNF